MRKCRQCGGGKWYVRQNDNGQGWIIETNPYSGFAFDDEVEVEVTDERR